MARIMGKSAVLDQHKIRYDPNHLIWTISAQQAGVDELIKNHAKDEPVQGSKTLFLEEGNSQAGLKHIWARHSQDFKKLANVHSENDLQKYIKNIMSKGHYATWGYTKGQKGGFEVVYIVHNNLYLHVVFGSNGFIVTSIITNEKMANYDKLHY